MKRGPVQVAVIGIRYNRFPDEKGTERTNANGTREELGCQGSYNRFPDEKGTERLDW